MDPNTPQDQAQNQEQAQMTPKQQVSERIRAANNVLVTVKSNPSVDELAATIGLTLMLNKLGKHATAVFSDEVPSTLEFLKPEETIETNTDSLRDFIVSLDKSKADKLRYKVEENVVKIFITPYKTSISQDDLEFTQGDFNVDVVLALGVTQREELDQAITSHGRILHDATVVTVTAGQDYSELGQINWQEQAASSLSEMLVSISEALQGGLIDEQIATAFLTGIVSETERFSNTKTSPKVMTMAAQLMAAGANQQLIANELEKVIEVDVSTPGPAAADDQAGGDIAIDEAGTLSIPHDEPEAPQEPPAAEPEQAAELPELGNEAEETGETGETDTSAAPEQQAEEPLLPPSEQEKTKFLPPLPAQPPLESFEPGLTEDKPEENQDSMLPEHPAAVDGVDDEGNQIHIDVEGNLMRKAAAEPKHKVIQPLPPVSEPEPALPADPPAPEPAAPEPPQQPYRPPMSHFPPPPEVDLTPSPPIQDNTTLEEIERAAHSPHISETPPSTESARSAVEEALSQQPFDPAHQARTDIGGLPLGAPPESTSYDSFRLPDMSEGSSEQPVTDVSGNLPEQPQLPQASQPAPVFTLPGNDSPASAQSDSDQIAPPPVPPPMTGL